jgi:oxygen-dependent protoporphyrinogen oxidase
VAIVGGGIAGLSAAWYLQQRGVSYSLLERAQRWGGKILTEYVQGPDGTSFVVEGGPDSFIRQKPWAEDLAVELGMTDRLLGTNDFQRQVYVLNRGKPVPLPDGVLLVVPTKFTPFALSPLISPLGKLRMGLDLFIPAKRDGADETLADFIRRRLGSEALDKIAEPLMSGIYNAEAERQSVLATFPRFRKIEETYGSLTRGMLAAQRARRKQPPVASNGTSSNGRPRSTFVSLRDGTEELVASLVGRLVGDLRLDCAVEAVERIDGQYGLVLSDGSLLVADAIVLATPAFVTSQLVRSLASRAADLLESIRYVSTGTVSLAYRQSDMASAPAGFGLVVPRSEGRPINAVTWSSSKFAHRAPDGMELLRVFFGGSRSPQSMALDDKELVAMVRGELGELLGVSASPLFSRIYRWHRSNPQYDVGHLQRVSAIEEALPQGLFVTGSPYRGVGIPDCVKQGKETAVLVAEYLR